MLSVQPRNNGVVLCGLMRFIEFGSLVGADTQCSQFVVDSGRKRYGPTKSEHLLLNEKI